MMYDEIKKRVIEAVKTSAPGLDSVAQNHLITAAINIAYTAADDSYKTGLQDSKPSFGRISEATAQSEHLKITRDVITDVINSINTKGQDGPILDNAKVISLCTEVAAWLAERSFDKGVQYGRSRVPADGFNHSIPFGPGTSVTARYIEDNTRWIADKIMALRHRLTVALNQDVSGDQVQGIADTMYEALKRGIEQGTRDATKDFQEALIAVKDKLNGKEPYGYLISYGYRTRTIRMTLYTTMLTTLTPTEFILVAKYNSADSGDYHLTEVIELSKQEYERAQAIEEQARQCQSGLGDHNATGDR